MEPAMTHSTPPLVPVPDELPHHTAYGVDGRAHQHGAGCFWDLTQCGWRCAPAAATAPPGPDGVLSGDCPEVA
jgi:hypothetical protein